MKKTKIILEIFDEETFDFVKKFKKDAYIKVSCSEADNLNTINKSIKFFKKVFINFSGFEINEIEYVLKELNIKKKL